MDIKKAKPTRQTKIDLKVVNNPFLREQKKLTIKELALYTMEFIRFATDPRHKTLPSRANMVIWLLLNKNIHLSKSHLSNLSKKPEFKPIIDTLTLAQKSFLETRSAFEFKGMSGPIVLMLKNLGYQDTVINQNVEMPSFTFGHKPVIEHTDTVDEKGNKIDFAKNQKLLEIWDLED